MPPLTSLIGSNLGVLGLIGPDDNTSALGSNPAQNAFPMPSDLNRAFAIIGGQEDPAIKQQQINLQTAATIGQLKNQQQEMNIKKLEAFPKIMQFMMMSSMMMPDQTHRDNLAQSISNLSGIDKETLKGMMNNTGSMLAGASRYKYAQAAGLTTSAEIMTAVTEAHPELLNMLEKKNQLGAAIQSDKELAKIEAAGGTIPKDHQTLSLLLAQRLGDPTIQYLLPESFFKNRGVISPEQQGRAQEKAIEQQAAADIIGSAERAKFNEYGIDLPANVSTWSQLKTMAPEAAINLRTAIKQEKVDQKQFETNLALGKFRLEQEFKTPPPGTYLDKEGNPQLPPNTMGEVKAAGLKRLDQAQEKMWTASGNLKTHNDLMMQYFDILSKSGIKPTAYLTAEMQILNNNPKAKALFDQLGALTSLAVTNAVAAGTGMRGGVQMGEYVRPSTVDKGDSGEVAIEKGLNLNKIAISRLKDNGLPVPKDLTDQRILLNALKEGKRVTTLPDGRMAVVR